MNQISASLWCVGQKRVAVLFADVRNSTPLWEIARLGGERHIHRVQALFGAWLGYAARLITVSGAGQIQRFSGDGFMATFGQDSACNGAPHAALGAAVLAVHSAKWLVTSFARLHLHWRKHPSVKRFYFDYNEDVDVGLGVGISFGWVHFGYLGFARTQDESGLECAGQLEFTPMGDHVNTAQRLESIAGKSVRDLDLYYRGESFADDSFLAPIVLSQTMSVYLPTILGKTEAQVHKRKGVARFKGKGLMLPFLEIAPGDIREQRCSDVLKDTPLGVCRWQLINPPSVKTAIEDLDFQMTKADMNI